MKYLSRALLCALLLFSSSIFASPVNINSASASEMAQSLNGIGEKKAQAIVDYREKNGHFSSMDMLLNVKGIGQSIISKNKENILLK